MSEDYFKMFDFSSSEEKEKEKYSKLKRHFKEIIRKATGRSIEETNVTNTPETRSAKNKNVQAEAMLKQFTDLKEYQKKMEDSLSTKTKHLAKHSKKFMRSRVLSSDSDSSVRCEKLQTVRVPTRKRSDNEEKKEKCQVKIEEGNLKKDGRYSPFSDESDEAVQSATQESASSESSDSQENPTMSVSRVNSKLSLGSKSQSEKLSERSYGTSTVPSPTFFDLKNELCQEIRREGNIRESRRSSSEEEQTLETSDWGIDQEGSRGIYQSTKPSSSSSEASGTSPNRHLQEIYHPESPRINPVRADSQLSENESPTKTIISNKETSCEDKSVKATISSVSIPAQKTPQPTIVQSEPPLKSPPETNLQNVAKQTIDETEERVNVVTVAEANDVFTKKDRSEDLKKKFPFCNQSDDELIRQTVQELEEIDREENLKTEGCTPNTTAYPPDGKDGSSGGDGDTPNCSSYKDVLLERIDKLQEEIMALRRELEEVKQHNEREARDVSFMSNLLMGHNGSPAIRNELQWEDWELKEMVRERMREKREAASLEYQARLKAVDALCTAELGRLEQALEALLPLDWKASSWGSSAERSSGLRSSWMTQDYFLEVVTSMNLSSPGQKASSSGSAITANGELPSSVEPKTENQ